MSELESSADLQLFRSPLAPPDRLPGQPIKLILRNNQSPGDVTMLTAAVRDLHAGYPGRFETDVRGECPDLWLHNPHLTPLNEEDAAVRVIHCRYPLINHSNQRPYHFLHGFTHFLNRELRLAIRPRAIKGDIHLSEIEQQMPSAVAEIIGKDIPFWIVAAGGKTDYTVKWWSTDRFQAVMDALRNRVLFVQIGLENDHHPPLGGVLDLRGKTSLRQLVLLIHHSQGVLCPVTGAMHLAAAVPVKSGAPKLRPCVVVAGGREPPHWESYPNHQFIHTVGMLTCCETGGCWRKRTVALGDGDKRDQPENLCLQVVDGPLPRCMSMITPEEVVRRIEGYFTGGIVRYLLPDEVQAIKRAGILQN
jgi:ADP-heptose:LPS heptosyltransferase